MLLNPEHHEKGNSEAQHCTKVSCKKRRLFIQLRAEYAFFPQ